MTHTLSTYSRSAESAGPKTSNGVTLGGQVRSGAWPSVGQLNNLRVMVNFSQFAELIRQEISGDATLGGQVSTDETTFVRGGRI